jgi:hypothetical protein
MKIKSRNPEQASDRDPSAMTDAADDPRSVARQNRLRDALRENLKRRKAQLRGRGEQPVAPQDRAVAVSTMPVEPESDPSS